MKAMKPNPPSARRRKPGFLLLEVVLALAVFSAVATSLVVAFHQMGKAAALTQTELRLTRILDSALVETLSLPVLEEGTLTNSVGETGMEMITTISILDNLEAEDGQILQEMYHIVVTARWYDGGEWKERSAETWRYGRMYQP